MKLPNDIDAATRLEIVKIAIGIVDDVAYERNEIAEQLEDIISTSETIYKFVIDDTNS